jgi:hypothetical protein
VLSTAEAARTLCTFSERLKTSPFKANHLIRVSLAEKPTGNSQAENAILKAESVRSIDRFRGLDSYDCNRFLVCFHRMFTGDGLLPEVVVTRRQEAENAIRSYYAAEVRAAMFLRQGIALSSSCGFRHPKLKLIVSIWNRYATSARWSRRFFIESEKRYPRREFPLPPAACRSTSSCADR